MMLNFKDLKEAVESINNIGVKDVAVWHNGTGPQQKVTLAIKTSINMIYYVLTYDGLKIETEEREFK